MFLYLQMIETAQDRSKFEQVYLGYRDLMYSVAYSITKNPQDAEDAVHHAFVKIAENISKISQPLCPKTKGYVVTIVENTAINLYNRMKRHPAVSLDALNVGICVEYTGSNELARCMAALPAQYRQVLLLKHYHGYTTQEIAKMLNLSAANTSKIHQRAKDKLEALCKEAGLI